MAHTLFVTTVLNSFEVFRANLELTAPQASVLTARQDEVRTAVAQQLSVTGAFVTGSYRRNTLIAPLAEADVDIMIVLDRSLRKSGPASVLDKVKRVLVTSYPRSEVSRNG